MQSVPNVEVTAATWNNWQEEVVEVIRAEYEDLFATVGKDDIDWNEWKRLYEEGHTPYAAVNSAFERTA